MIIKTSFICAALTLAFVIFQLSTILVGMDNSNLKSQLESGGYLKPYVQMEASEMAVKKGESNV